MKILILMGGERIEGKADAYPLYMAEINRKMVLERQLEKCKTVDVSQILCCVKTEDIKDFHIDEVITQETDKAVCVPIHNKTQGAVCTALLAGEYINNNEELIILAVDEILDTNFSDLIEFFRNQNSDCGLVSFTSSHPRYSYAKLGENGKVCEVAEKRPFSKNALASFFYFKTGVNFLKCAESVIRKDNPLNNAFYISQVVNEIILNQQNVNLITVDFDEFHPIKNELQLFEYVQGLKR